MVLKNYSPRSIVRVGTLGLVTGLLAACSGASGESADTHSWRLAENQPESFPHAEASAWFAEEIEERSDGRISVDVFANGQLGEETEVLEQVQSGAIEMARTSSSSVSDFAPAWNVFSLPYIFDDEDHMWDYLLSEYGEDHLQEDMEEAGFVGLTFYASGGRNFYTASEPIREPSDMQGQNIRVQPGSVNVDMVEALGGSATVMDYGEVYSALQTGVIDGAENNPASFVSSGHHEVAPHFTLDGHQHQPDPLVISEQVWDSLSSSDQDLVSEVAEEATEVLRDLWGTAVEEAMTEMENSGVEIYDVDVEEFQEAVAPVIEQYEDEYGDVLENIDSTRN